MMIPIMQLCCLTDTGGRLKRTMYVPLRFNLAPLTRGPVGMTTRKRQGRKKRKQGSKKEQLKDVSKVHRSSKGRGDKRMQRRENKEDKTVIKKKKERAKIMIPVVASGVPGDGQTLREIVSVQCACNSPERQRDRRQRRVSYTTSTWGLWEHTHTHTHTHTQTHTHIYTHWQTHIHTQCCILNLNYVSPSLQRLTSSSFKVSF